MNGDGRGPITYAVVAAYIIFAAAALYRMLFSDAELPHLDAALALLAGIGAWVGQIVERRLTQASHERREALEAANGRD